MLACRALPWYTCSMAKKPRKDDLNVLAHSIMAQATGQEPQDQSKKNPAAVALGRLGGLKGGKARAAKLSAAQRKTIAAKAAKARWTKKSD